jgi:prepilin-type N-terminal cleavage/methylation domain-containing protein
MVTRRNDKGRQQGFGLIELVVVIVLMSVLATYAAVRWNSNARSTVAYQAEQFARNLRHAQMLAMTQNVTLTVTVAAAGYSVSDGVGIITDPALGEPFNIALANGVVFSAGAGAISFDGLGRPKTGAAFNSAAQAFTLNGDGSTWTVSVAPLTGFVSVATP